MNKNYIIMSIVFLITMFFASAYSTSNLVNYYSFDNSTSNLNNMIDSNTNNINNSLITGHTTYRSFKIGIKNTGLYTAYNTGMYAQYTNLRDDVFYRMNTTAFNSSKSFSYNYWIKSESATDAGYQIIQTLGFLSSNDYSFALSYDNFYTDYAWNAYDYHNLYCISASTTNQLCSYYSINPSPIYNNNTWEMVTVTYNIDTGYLKIYINGEFRDSKLTSNIIPQNNNLVALTYPYNSTIDELSLWNMSLDSFDIMQLYNNGTGLNYNQTTNNNISLLQQPPICWYNYYYTIYDELNSIYYQAGDYGYCPNGCINGSCIQNVTCNYNNTANYCNVIGMTSCSGSTQYITCDFTQNNCPSWSIPQNCPPYNYCTNIQNGLGFNQASCSLLNLTAGISNITEFTVTPYNNNEYDFFTGLFTGNTRNETNTAYTIDYNTHTLKVDTRALIHVQGFGINSLPYDTYMTTVCDYKEYPVYEITTPTIINNSNTYTYPVTNTNHIYEFNFALNNNSTNTSNMTITLLDSFNTEILSFLYTKDDTSKNVCLYDYMQAQLLFCDVSTNSYNDLVDINVKINIDVASNTYTISSIISRTNLNLSYHSIPQIYIGNNFNKINFVNGSNAILENLSIKTMTPFDGFRKTVYNDFHLLTCTYSTTGCRVARTYLNLDGSPDITNYKDWNICINTLNNPTPLDTSNSWDKNIPTSTKYFIALAIFMLIIGVGTGIGFSIQNPSGGFTIGVICAFFSLIAFTILGWISAWVLVAIIIVGIATTILVSKSSNNSGGSGV